MSGDATATATFVLFTFTAVNPTFGTANVTNAGVTVIGSAFAAAGAGTPTVTVGGELATNVTVQSDTTVTATFPAKAVGPYAVTVTNAIGTATLPGAFTYQNPAPTISTVAPSTGPPSASTAVTITGAYFQAAGAGTPTVTVGGTAAGAVTVVNDTTVTATFPAKAAGAYNVVLTNAYGNSTLVNGFAYGLAPLLTTVSPTTGTIDTASTGVSLTGSRFASAGRPSRSAAQRQER
jgi:hypothetical protein